MRKRPIQYMRSLQNQSGRVPIDPNLKNHVQIPYGWTEYIYHVGSTLDHRSISEGGLIAGRVELRNVFLCACGPHEHPDHVPRLEASQPRVISYISQWERSHDAVYGFESKLALDKGLGFWQTVANAIILFESMPCVNVGEAKEHVRGRSHMREPAWEPTPWK